MKFADKRFVIKFSGEALGRPDHGIWEAAYLDHVCGEIASLYPEMERTIGSLPHIAVLLGGGNILRGANLKERAGMQDGVVADECGMRATVINCMILQERLENEYKLQTRLMTAWEDSAAGEKYIRRRALRHMEKGRLVILAGGTGKPDCSTDRALTQYGRELGADLLLKASKVDGIYTSDPHATFQELRANPPEHIPYLTYGQFLAEPERFRQILDRGAVTQAEQHGMVIRVFNARKEGALVGVIYEQEGFLFTDVGPEHPKFGHQRLPPSRLVRTGSQPVSFGDENEYDKDPDVFEMPVKLIEPVPDEELSGDENIRKRDKELGDAFGEDFEL